MCRLSIMMELKNWGCGYIEPQDPVLLLDCVGVVVEDFREVQYGWMDDFIYADPSLVETLD